MTVISLTQGTGEFAFIKQSTLKFMLTSHHVCLIQDVFDAASADKLDIIAFTEEEIKETFDEFDADRNGHMDTRCGP
jgi:hypothetical protein